jgi:hypothetical protein
MARLNLVPNPSFRLGTDGYSATGGALISIAPGLGFYGNESLLVSKAARNDSGVQTAMIPIVPGKDYAFSVYASVPNTVPPQEDAGLLLRTSWYSPLGVFISDSTSDVVTVSDSDGWVRLTGVDSAPLGAVTARLSLAQLTAGRVRQTFRADAFLFEQASYVGGYLDNLAQSQESRLVNSALSALPLPPVGGLQLDADIILGDLVLNTIDEYNVVWVCTDIPGWWGHSSTDTVDIPRGVEDGSYDVSGRYESRVFTLEGSFLLPDPALLGAARDRLVAATNLIRRGAWLRTNENPTRAAFVRLSGTPKIETVNARGRTDFSIGLKAADPIRYEWNDEDQDGLSTETIKIGTPIRNLATNPSFEDSDASYYDKFNYVFNPDAQGTKQSLGVPIEVDPQTNERAFKFTAGTSAGVATRLVTEERAPVTPGQRWWVRGRVRRDDSVYGARTWQLGVSFYNSAGVRTSNDLYASQTSVPSGVFHRWTGAPNASTSEEYNGIVKRVNEIQNPGFGVSTAGYVALSSTTLTRDADTNTMAVTLGADLAVDSPLFASNEIKTLSAGSVRSGRMDVTNTSATAKTFYARLTVFGSAGTSTLTTNGSAVVVAPGATATLLVENQVAPTDSSGGYRIYLMSGSALTTGEVYRADNVMTVAAATADTYFDGDSPSTGIGIDTTYYDMSYSAVAPSDAVSAEIFVLRSSYGSPAASDILRFDRLMLTQAESTIVPEYFDGSSTFPEMDRIASWSGTTNASISRTGFRGIRGVGGQGADVFQSSAWAVTGNYSLRIVSTTNTPESALADLLPMSEVALVPGKTYTASIIVHRDTPATQLASLSYLAYQGQNLLLYKPTQAAKTAGDQVLTLTFTVPLDTTLSYLRLYSAETVGGPDLWADHFILTEGNTPVNYFDGNSESTPDSAYVWAGTPNRSASVKRPGEVMVGSVTNIGTADVTGVFELVGPLGENSEFTNTRTDETIRIVDELRGVGGTATITNKELTDNNVTLTTSSPHKLVVGDQVIVSGLGSPFDAVNEILTVTAVTDLLPYTFNYRRQWPDIDSSKAAGQVSLANNDVLSIDTYKRSVSFNGEIRGNRSRVSTLVDWIKLAPGANTIALTDKATRKRVVSKGIRSNVMTFKTQDAHFFVPGENVYINLPTEATLARKSLTSNVVTLTTATDHGFSVGDSVNVESTETVNITNKALTSNVATLTTASLGAFNVGDLIVVTLPTTQTLASKSATNGVATLTTAAAHGFSQGDSVTIALTTTAPIRSKSISLGVATLNTTVAHGFSVGDSISVTLPSTTTAISKYVSGQVVVLTTSTAHNYSIGDRVTISLPVSAALSNTRSMTGAPNYLATLNTTAAHGFSVGDKITVSTGVQATFGITARSATTTTATIAIGAHSIKSGDIVTISGVSNSRYNGRYVVTAAGATTIAVSGSFTAEASVSSGGTLVWDTVATGYNGAHIIETIPTSTSFTFLYYGQNDATTSTTAGTGTVTNDSNTAINGTFAITSTPTATQFSYNV